MSAIESKLNAIMSRMSSQERKSHSANKVGNMEGTEHKCVVDEGLAHEGPYQVEEVQYLKGNMSYNFKPNNNFLTHYTPALRNHEKFSYGGGLQQSLRLMQNFQQNYTPPGFQGQQQGSQRVDNQGQRRSQSFED